MWGVIFNIMVNELGPFLTVIFSYWVKYTHGFLTNSSCHPAALCHRMPMGLKFLRLILPLQRTIGIWIWFAHLLGRQSKFPSVGLSWQWAPLVLFGVFTIIMMMSLFTLLLSLLLLSGDPCSGVELPVTDGASFIGHLYATDSPAILSLYYEAGCF